MLLLPWLYEYSDVQHNAFILLSRLPRRHSVVVAISATFSCSCIAVIAVSLVVVSLLLCVYHPIKTVQSMLTMGRQMTLC